MAAANAFHVSVRIDRPYDEVYAFVANPRNMPKWAAGLSSGLEEDRTRGDWVGKGAEGDDKRVRFTERNRFGVADHVVTLADGSTVHVPLRVLRSGEGSEVVLTLFRQPKMSDAELAADRASIERDLAKLTRLLESGDTGPRPKPLEHVRFPNESDGYRAARNALLEAEMDLRRHLESVAAQRRALPPGGVVPHDYVFERMSAEGRPEKVKLSELFSEGKDTLLIYSFMFGPGRPPCNGCTHMLDELDPALRHGLQKLDFLVVAKSPIQRIVDLGRERGWRYLPLASTAGNDYDKDYYGDSQRLTPAMRKQQNFKDGEEWDMPMLNVFQRTAEGIRHTWGSELLWVPAEPGQQYRHNDLIDPVYNLLDLTPGGRGDFEPQLEYR
jgi:predicted dithiol-disulfide oxidoreductase (DUF899 family)/uncharacterized protein YndB with AHSA1/START domain